jgi:hypothetical protein
MSQSASLGNLREALSALPALDAATEARASRRLFDLLVTWAPRWLMRSVAWPSTMLGAEKSDLAWEACEHLVIVSVSGDAAFSGCSERAAVAWCCTVLKNYVGGRLRKARRQEASRSQLQNAFDVRTAEPEEPPLHGIEDACRLLQAEISAGTRPIFVDSVLRSFHHFVAHRFGLAQSPSQDLGLDTVLSLPPSKLVEYQWRRRGKVAAEKAYSRLRRSRLDPMLEATIRCLLDDTRGRSLAATKTPCGTVRSSPQRANQTRQRTGEQLARPA